MAIADVEKLGAVCVVGSNLRREVPLLAHRVRKAALNGAHVSFVNTQRYEYLFDVGEYRVADDLTAELGALIDVARGQAVEGDAHGNIVTALRDADSAAVVIGQIGMRHPRFAEIRALASQLCELTGAQLAFVSEGANAAGLSLAGVLPHRGIGGATVEQVGATAADIVANPKQGLLLFGVEPQFDCADATDGLLAVEKAGFVIALSPFFDETLKAHADVVLPVATFAETSGTFVNAGGNWQSFGGIAMPFGESRPGWKVLRVLGNMLDLPDCEYMTSESVRDELNAIVRDANALALPGNRISGEVPAGSVNQAAGAELDIPMYRIDALVRRSRSLQLTREGQADESFNGRDAAQGRKIA
jgi:NADH-quinone oxidoreductase subunit G